jgi:hypothetical protein
MNSRGKAAPTKTIYANVSATGNLFKLYGKMQLLIHAGKNGGSASSSSSEYLIFICLTERDVIILMKTNLYYYRDASSGGWVCECGILILTVRETSGEPN